jgi:hypothetical protein
MTGSAWAADPTIQGFTIGDDINVTSSAGIGYVLEKNSSGKWTLSAETDVTRENLERIFIDLDAKRITLGVPFFDIKGIRQAGTYRRVACAKGRLAFKGRSEGGKYNACDSAFTKAAAETGLLTAISAPLTGLLVQTVSYSVVVDQDALANAVSEAGLVERAMADRDALKLGTYRTAYVTASQEGSPAAALQRFIDTYTKAGYDPDNLLPAAGQLVDEKRRRQEQLALEAAETKRQELARIELDNEQKRKSEAAQAEASARDAAAKALEDLRRRTEETKRFRASLRVETETNCGPVIEARGNLLKIYSPVSNYGNEHWIPRGQVFPPGYGCRFFNGHYQPPYDF